MMPVRLCISRYASSLGPLRPYRRLARPFTCYMCVIALFSWDPAPLDPRAQKSPQAARMLSPARASPRPPVFPASAGSSTCSPDLLVWGPTAPCERRRAGLRPGLGPLRL
jgi:hypothetical protein